MQPPRKQKTAKSSQHARGTNYDPWEHAESLGLQVLHRPLREAISIWMPTHHTIVIRSCLSYVCERATLARMVGHSALGHGFEYQQNEHEADRFAVVNLVSPIEYEHAIQETGNLATVSDLLKVTRRLLHVYLLQVV